MHIPSLFVTFLSALLFGILKPMMGDDASVALILCIPVTLICTIVGLIKSEGKTKLLVIPVQGAIWLICVLLGVNIFKGMLAIAILGIGGVFLYIFLKRIFGNEEDTAKESWGGSLPKKLIDAAGGKWMKDTFTDTEAAYVYWVRKKDTGELIRYNEMTLHEQTSEVDPTNHIVRDLDSDRTYHWEDQ